jgi:hypothetical protein
MSGSSSRDVRTQDTLIDLISASWRDDMFLLEKVGCTENELRPLVSLLQGQNISEIVGGGHDLQPPLSLS